MLFARLKSKKAVSKILPTAEKAEDYFIPPLAPYVQWVKAYSQLVSLLYEENKTVAKAWRAFTNAVPGIEQRLEFGVFEQILLFSLFLAEWNESEKTSPSREIVAQQGASSPSALPEGTDERLEQVIQELREAVVERDSALWNMKNYEREALALQERNAHLENETADFDNSLQLLRNDLDGTCELLNRVTQELDASRAEIASLREQSAALKAQKTLLEKQMEELREKRQPAASGGAPASPTADVEPADPPDGPVQAVIQWRKRSVTQEVIQKSPGPPSRKIGKWNAQLSKDGYYRLYRKIGGKLHSIYIGKELDVEKAQTKIAEKERELLGPGQEPLEP